MQNRSLTSLALDEQLQLQYNSVIAALEYEGRAGLAVASTIAALPSVAPAILSGDRDGLMRLLGDAQAALQAQGIPFIPLTAAPATAFLRVHDPRSFGDDISGRRETVFVSNRSGKPVVGVEPGRDTLAIFAIAPILRDGTSIAVVDVGITFGKEFIERAKRRFGIDMAVHFLKDNAFQTTGSTFADAIATTAELHRALAGETVRRDVELNGHPAAMFLGQIRNHFVRPVAVIELIKDTTAYQQASARAQRDLITGTFVVLAIGSGLALQQAFDESTRIYKERGFQRRIGFGRRPALISVDLANAWTRPGSPFTCDGMEERIIPGMQRLLRACRDNGHVVVHVTTAYQNTNRQDPTTDMGLWHCKLPVEAVNLADTELWAIDSRIAPVEGEFVMLKKRASGFSGTPLAGYLRAAGVDTILVTGVTATACVRTTICDGLAEGFRTIAVRECIGDRVPGAVAWNLFDIDAKFADVEAVDTCVAYLNGVNAGAIA